MARDKAIPGSGPDFGAGPDSAPASGPGSGPDSRPDFGFGSGSASGFGVDGGRESELDLERAFRRRLDDELADQGSRPMAEVVARAASRGRRRVLVRTGGIVAAVAAVVAVIGGAATIAVQDGESAPERAAIPPPTVDRPTAPSADGRLEAARAAIARDLGEVLTGLLPQGSWSPVRTGYAPDTGISAEVTREDGDGPGGVVSVSLRPGALTDCPATVATPAEHRDAFGLTHSIKCVGLDRNGNAVAAETVLAGDGPFRAQGVHLSVGSTVLRLIWSNGPLDGKIPQSIKGRPALTDDAGKEIARSTQWERVARRLLESGVGTG
ncbi:hypothetical protein ACFZBU_23895 [Embleya sp. NPDC008237]|uniref:hypothetical protein n=1 Tax=Embleya sp. NPDC008237 TaxID=3363978 RepID=UPI0036EF0FC7